MKIVLQTFEPCDKLIFRISQHNKNPSLLLDSIKHITWRCVKIYQLTQKVLPARKTIHYCTH